MSESKLIKDWKSSDVQRMRNLLTNNSSNTTKPQIGYNKKYTDYEEGSIWEERGKKWTIKNGIKQTVTRFDAIKKQIFTPITCPNCNRPMTKGHFDKYMFKIHQKCSDCVIDYETKLKVKGEWKEYEQNMIKQGVTYHIKEMENVLLELLMGQSGESYVTEAGDIEEWKGKSLDNQFIKDIQEYIQKLKDAMNA
jgi:hypothetical protein